MPIRGTKPSTRNRKSEEQERQMINLIGDMLSLSPMEHPGNLIARITQDRSQEKKN